MTVIQGRVVDRQGRPVAGAAVYIVAAPVGMPDIAQLTDEHGQFAIAAAVPGQYTVAARSDELGVAQSDVEAGGDEPAAVEIRLVLSKGSSDGTF